MSDIAMKTILFPTDFSERTHPALDQAITYAERLKMKLVIYHAYYRPATEWNTGRKLSESLQALEQGIDFKFEKLLDQHKKLRTVPHEFRKGLGISTEGILSAAQEASTHLIIMATKGAKGFGELWGTKTAQIIQDTPVPVLVLPDNTRWEGFAKVGLVCDYSEAANYHTLDFLAELVKALQLEVDVITLHRDEGAMTSQQLAYQQLVRKQLDGVPTTFHSVVHDKVEEGIVDYCQANAIGLIAILPKSYPFIKALFRESLTEKMAFHSPIPLLVLK